MRLLNKKAAMFGLDARIALAIFGALSVITGAALYSAIQYSKVISAVAQLEEVTKACEAYLLDTGMQIRKIVEIDAGHANAAFGLYGNDLVSDSGVSGWKGPYLPLEHIGDGVLKSILNTLLGFVKIDVGVWGGATGAIACTVEKDCRIWLQMTLSEELVKNLDIYLDGSETKNTGRVRRLNSYPKILFYNTGIVYTNM